MSEPQGATIQPIGWIRPFVYGLVFLLLLWGCMALWSMPPVWLYLVGFIGGPISAGIGICYIVDARDGRVRPEIDEWLHDAGVEIVRWVAWLARRERR